MFTCMNTHSATISFVDGSRAFVDGIPDTCQHKEFDPVYQSASGKMIFWHTYKQWRQLNNQMRDQLIFEHHNNIEDPIVMGTSQCRLCKKNRFS